MADQQRIHPVHDPEAPQKPTAPLVPPGSSMSDKGDPPPRFRRTIPLSYSPPPKRSRSCCRKCLCWTVCLLLLQIIVIAILAAAVYFVFQPKIPKYSVDGMRITQFNLSTDNSLYAAFNVKITARNPNKKIGIYYRGGSHISVWYSGDQLCQGALPEFYQGHRNTTVMEVGLTGETQDATGLLQSLQADKQTGSVPLNLRVKVPVRIKIGSVKLMKWKFVVKCKLLVDTLAADNEIKIKSSSCKFRFRL
ncbi:NDR1/HIN1-like protein 6 [Diospyros lotus]|uniref:NDR1/HIN1-like protein 6 n=1 Tax=Diospyros lotus TaxID=55363 RepID=UPI002251BB54|nr:NDR1/HIN1-like protein 6 [Diospyros lotus]